MQTRRTTRAQSQAAIGSPAPRVTQAESRQFELRARPEVRRQPVTKEPDESRETEESEESLGASDSDTDSGLPDPPEVTSMMTTIVMRVQRKKIHHRRNPDAFESLLLC